MDIDRRFYVYIYFRLNGIPCYVGRGVGNRWVRHEYKSTNPHLANIIKNAGGKLPRVKIREGLTQNEANEIEVAFIKAIGREVNGGPLVNMTDGGEGTVGHTVSEDGKKKMRIARLSLGQEWQDKNNAARAEAMKKPEVKEKIGAYFRNKSISEKHRANIKANHSHRVPSREEALLVAEKNRGKKRTKESRLLMSEKRKAWLVAHPGWKRGAHSQETKDLLSRKTKEYYDAHPERKVFSEEHRKNLRLAANRRFASIEDCNAFQQ